MPCVQHRFDWLKSFDAFLLGNAGPHFFLGASVLQF